MSKIEQVKRILKRDGGISNIETVYGTHGVRTTRLADVISKLRAKGYKIQTNVERSENGGYIDCHYFLKALPKKKMK